GIRDFHVTGVQTCALPISPRTNGSAAGANGNGDKPKRARRTRIKKSEEKVEAPRMTDEETDLPAPQEEPVKERTLFPEKKEEKRSEERRVGKECRKREGTE